MPEVFAVETRGIGKPDYSREVSSSKQRAGYALKYGESLKYLAITCTDLVPFPYLNPGVQPLLAAGDTAHLIDSETGLATGLVIPQGYTATLMMWEWTGNQDLVIWHYISYDPFGLILMGSPGMSGPGANLCFNALVPVSTSYFDPTGATAHTWDVTITNRSTTDPFSGTVDFAFLLEPVGTPPLPTIKTCRCPFCGHEEKKPVTTTSVTCEECGQLYILWSLPRVQKPG